MFKRLADWWYGPRETRHPVVDQSHERVHRKGSHIWSITDDGQIFLFGIRPGKTRRRQTSQDGLQTRIWEHQSRTGTIVTALVVTAAMAHDLIAQGELTAKMIRRSLVLKDDVWRIVIPHFFQSNADLIIVNELADLDWQFHELPRFEETSAGTKPAFAGS